MRARNRYQLVAGVTLFSLLVAACSCGEELTPTPFPYAPPPPGTISPIVVQRTPEPREELPLDGAIELSFDRAMDKDSVEGAFRVFPEVSGSFEWSDDRTVSFKPSLSLERDTHYEVTVGPDAEATDGAVIDGSYRFRFQTVGYLKVTQVIPAPGSEDVEADSVVTVIFNRPVVPLTAVSDPAYGGLPQPVTLDPPVEGDGEWLNTSIYVISPDEPLAGGTAYSAVVEAGLEDTTGGVLAEDYSWSFSTQPPQVVWVSPSEGSDLVDVDTSVRVTFNMEVDPASAAEAFLLRAGGQQVSGQVEIEGSLLVFTPTERLAFDTTYTARVDAGVRSGGGGDGMKGAYQWTFATVPLPRIIGTDPADGDLNARPYTRFEIFFNTPIDPDTVMPNLEMTPPLSPTQVYTYFSTWNNSFVLDFGVQPSTDYEVRIGPSIADPYGNTTGQEMTVRFRTAALEPWLQLRAFGYLGTYDANQPAKMVVAYLNTPRLDLSLYRVDIEEVLRAYEEWYEYEPAGVAIRQWSQPVESALNEIGYAVVDLAEDGGALPPGAYLLTLEAPGVEHDRWMQRIMLAVSEYNLTLKASADEAWAWATDLATGEPVKGLRLTAWSDTGLKRGAATTDSDGLASLAMPSWDRHGLFVASEDPFVLAGTGWEWEDGISPWEFGLEMEPADPGLSYRGYVYTDRPIYRQGQTVYFRGILRAMEDVGYSLPAGATVEVTVFDAAAEEIFSRGLTLDEYGAFDGEIELGDGAALGYYTIEVWRGDSRFAGEFAVAAYRPPEFEVAVIPQKAELVSGQATRAEVEASYYFGGPVAGASVEWNVLAEPYTFEPTQFGRYTFSDRDDPWICRWCWWWEPPQREAILSGSGTTDDDGGLSILLPSDIMAGAQRLTIEATVYGSDGQAISGRGEVVVHQGEFYVGLAPQNYVGRAGDELAVDVVTVDWSGERLPSQELEMEVYRREWINTFVEDEFGGGTWEWETEDTLVESGALSTDADAEEVASFTPAEGGSYRMVVSGRDGGGRLVRSSVWLWVGSDDYVSWRRENNDRITLISDKTTYAPGDTAEILIPTPFEGEQWVWITVERAGILHQEVVQLDGNSLVYRLPITADHAPNVYFSAVVVKGPDATEPVATHRVGYVLLTVEHTQQELDITLTPSVEQAGPGDTVSFDVMVTDYSGSPVEASFSIDLVDKAVLSLSPRTEDEIVQAFYSQRGLGVSTASGLVVSINRLLLRQMEQLGLDYGGGGMGGGGANGEADAAPMPTAMPGIPIEERAGVADEGAGVELRQRFEDTAFWDATVVTGRDGHASVEIELPDNLTTWVCRAVGVTVDTEVGEELAELVATKPLLVRPVTPRFFVVDDRVQLAALVSNNTGESQDVEVTLEVAGLSLEDEAAQTVSIADGAEAKVTWWATAQDVEVAEVIVSAVAGEYSDASRPRLTTGPDGTLLVHRYTAPEIVGTGGQLVGEDTRTEVVALPPKYDDRQGELSVRLDPSLAAGMTDGLSYLEHYPYECTEQIVSRFLPNVLTYRALQELGLSDAALEAKLPDLVQEGLDKLYLRQRSDGGWGWWNKDEEYGESNPHLSAYVVLALIKAEEAGFAVRNRVLRDGLDYLQSQLVSAGELRTYREGNLQAFILFVMAEAGETDEAQRQAGSLYRRRERLSHYGRAFLALALGRIDEDDSRIDTLLSDLQNAAILSATGAHWEEEDYDYWGMNTDTRSTAVILEALARLDPENALIQNVVRWLMVARQDGIWETTQETAWALISLTDWMVVTGELQGDYDYAVWLNEELQVQQAVTPETIDQPVQLSIEVAELLSDQGNQLAVGRGPGEGVLYYTAHLNVYLPVEEIEPLNRGIIVSRRYSDPDCTDGAKCPEVNEASVGDVVQVHLTIIAPHDLYYVVVEDPLPAGGEGIDTSLATTSVLDQEPGLTREVEADWPWFYGWWWRWFSRSEMRDDRVVLFADYLPAGTYEYTYTFRATQVGEYRVIPTTANEFYFPEVFGRASGRLLTVVE